MARIHLFEFEDQKWFPDFLRDYGTDFLQFLSNKTKMYRSVIPIIEKGLKSTKNNQVIDLGSGGGGGWLWLNEEILKNHPDFKLKLSDYYPNKTAFEFTKNKATNISYTLESIDARNVPNHLKGLRTQFLSLHHFKPKDAKEILQNAVDSGNSIAIFEAQERSFPSVLAMLLSPISVLFTTPFIRPFKFRRIFFTYLIPIVPIFVLWDGVVSSLRTYSIKEMNKLINSLNNKDRFEWEVGKKKSGPAIILYLLGTKKL